uniref:guanylate cyclase n=1 Tax=Strongyloides venezuelensis TaxID=75913 RepID=A0A0K0F1T0_STRVS
MNFTNMLGHVHVVLRDLLNIRATKKIWKIIQEKLKFNDDFFIFNKVYPDEETYKFIDTAAEELGMTHNEIMETLGEHFMEYVYTNGWKELLKSIAYDVFGFLNAVTSLHMFIDSLAFQNKVKGPSFYCEPNKDGTLKMHYYSVRPNLEYLVKGIVCKASVLLYDIPLHVQLTDKSSDKNLNHCIFNIQPLERNKKLQILNNVPTRNILQEPLLTLKDFVEIFPTHICFNRNMFIEHCGVFLSQQLNLSPSSPTRINDIFQIVTPLNTGLTFKGIISHMNTTFIVQVKKPFLRHMGNTKNGMSNTQPKPQQQHIFLKGQMILVGGGEYILFANSIHLDTVKSLLTSQIYLSDYPLFDTQRNVILLNQSRVCQQILNTKLEQTVNNLKKIATELEDLKTKTNTILYDTIPCQIADALKDKRPVEAKEFAEATCLLCDVPYFNIINNICSPKEVIGLMTDIFNTYESLVLLYDCHKIVSFMDTYFIASGVPNENPNHASNIMNLALGLLWQVKQFTVPIINLPILLRIAINTGPVVAGIIGSRKVRYCILGNTVNITKALLSHCEPGKIVVSNAARLSVMRNNGNEFSLQIKGYVQTCPKNATCVYYLEKNLNKSIYDIINSEEEANTPENFHNGYSRLNSITDIDAWELMNLNTKKQESVIDALKHHYILSNSFTSSTFKKIRKFKKAWNERAKNNDSKDSGTFTSSSTDLNNSIDESKVCNIM